MAGLRSNYARSPTAIRSCQEQEGTQPADKEQESTASHQRLNKPWEPLHVAFSLWPLCFHLRFSV